MTVDLLALAATAPGHLCLLILAINTSHAFPLVERWMGLLRIAILAAWLTATAGLVWATWGGSPWREWIPPILAYGALCVVVGWVGLPAVTILRALRGIDGVEEHGDVIDLAEPGGRDALIGPGSGAFFLRFPGCEFARLRRSEWTVEIPGLPPACDGLSLVQLSDLHFTRAFERRYFEAVADAVASWEADLLVFTGDLVDDVSTFDWIEPVLGRLSGRLGMFGILGNHDYIYDPGVIRGRFRRAGFEDVEGRWTTLEIGGTSIAIGGTAAPWGRPLDTAEAPEADLRIVLSHTPDLFYRLSDAPGIDLILAGHNHGGQVRVPVFGPILMPSRFSRRFDRGFFRRKGTLMYVNQGIAGKHPLRLGGCPPEISRLVLRPATSPRSDANRLEWARSHGEGEPVSTLSGDGSGRGARS